MVMCLISLHPSLSHQNFAVSPIIRVSNIFVIKREKPTMVTEQTRRVVMHWMPDTMAWKVYKHNCLAEL